MKVMVCKHVKSANGVALLIERYNLDFQGAKRGEVIVRAVTGTDGPEWAEVRRFTATMPEAVIWAKAAEVVVTGIRQAHVA